MTDPRLKRVCDAAFPGTGELPRHDKLRKLLGAILELESAGLPELMGRAYDIHTQLAAMETPGEPYGNVYYASLAIWRGHTGRAIAYIRKEMGES